MDTSALTRQEKAALLKTDFLNRNGDNYTSHRTTARLGWERTLFEGDAYSSLLVRPKDDADLHRMAHRYASNMVAAMNCPFKVKVVVAPGSGSFTDGKTLCVATDVFDDRDLTPGQKVDVFTGLAVHESSHLLYTDLGDWTDNRVLHTIDNIIEDERIEMLTGQERPGLANFLSATKYYYFGRHEKRCAEKGPQSGSARLMNAILALIRFPAALEEKDVDEFADALIEVRDILTPYPKSTEESHEAARKVYDVLKRYAGDKSARSSSEERKKQSRTDRECPESGDGSEEADRSNQSSGNSGEQEGSSADESKSERSGPGDSSPGDEQKDIESDGEVPDTDEAADTVAEDGSGDDSDGYEEDESSDEEDDESLPSDEEMERILQDVLDSLNRDVTEDPSDGSGQNAGMPEDRMSGEVKKDDKRLAKALAGELEIGRNNANIYHAKDNRTVYRQSLARIRKYIPAMSQALRRNGADRECNLRGLRNGRLDTNKLAEAVQGVEAIYRQDSTVRADRLTVCILVDESGSMDGDKIQAARDTAVLLREALETVPNVDLYIYGHTTERSRHVSVRLNIYQEGRGSGCPRYALGSIDSFYSNVDSIAIRECAARVRARTRDRCLFFVLSDGAPCESKDNVRKAVDDLTGDGFVMVSVGIEFDYSANGMYDNRISLTDMGSLAPELGKAVRKAIMDNSKRH
jgi:cobalamin biosynthesis protein CobT